MANKFTKSVLERQQKEQQITKPPEQIHDTTAAPITPKQIDNLSTSPIPLVTPTSAPKIADTPPAASAPTATKASAGMDLDAFIIREEGRRAKNKTFYLDAVVIEGLKKAAKEKNLAESKLVNDILKAVLGL